LQKAGNIAPSGWRFDVNNWWLDEKDLIMKVPDACWEIIRNKWRRAYFSADCGKTGRAPETVLVNVR
jgi:hypothetical protein